MRVLLIFSGTYPYHYGGVSVWAQNLISGLSEIEFEVLSVIAEPHLRVRYPLPQNLKRLYTLPLWGAELVEEYLEDASVLELASRRRRTTDKVAEEKFIPLFRPLLDYLLEEDGDPLKAGEALAELHKLFQIYDYGKLFRSEVTWRFFEEYLLREPSDVTYVEMSLSEITDSLRLFAHFLRPLALRLGSYDLIHSAIASFAGFVGIAQKILSGAPYLLTEHGVFYRERILDFVRYGRSYPYRSFWSRVFKQVAKLNYYWADRITSVTSFNREWEYMLGASPAKLEVIYNGVDVKKFRPMPEKTERWTVVSVIRIDYFKDPLNLIRAMDHVVKKIPEARCYIYGPVIVPEYAERCRREIFSLGLEEKVKFMGFTSKPEEAYNQGWVVVQPSMSEGTPISILEAMACGRPIVATDAGGVAEALGDAGIIVPVKNPRVLGDAVTRVLLEERLAWRLTKKARERAVKLFSLERMLSDYRRVYHELREGSSKVEDRLLGEADSRTRP